MKAFQWTTLALVLVTVACSGPVTGDDSKTYKMTTQIPEQVTTPDKVETSIGTLEFFDGVPIGNTTEMVYDYVDRARAVEVFINMTPAVSVYNIRKGTKRHRPHAVQSDRDRR